MNGDLMIRATNLTYISMALLSDLNFFFTLVISEVIVPEHADNETICRQFP